jgi:predicted enzyme related to lactoylglutathione lyase
MNEGRIDYIEFHAGDLPAVKKFYSSAFGWKFTDYGPGYCAFEDGRLTGGFTTAPGPRSGSPLVILYSEKLEAIKEKVIAAGGKISKDIFSFPGGRRFHFVGACGNELAVWSDR